MKNILFLVLFLSSFTVKAQFDHNYDYVDTMFIVEYTEPVVLCDTCLDDGCTKQYMIVTKKLVTLKKANCPKPLPPVVAPIYIPPTPDTLPKLECVFNPESWIDRYGNNCENAPKGRYRIQIAYTKTQAYFETPPSFKYVELYDACGWRYLVEKVYYTYCDAQKALREIQKDKRFTGAFIFQQFSNL